MRSAKIELSSCHRFLKSLSGARDPYEYQNAQALESSHCASEIGYEIRDGLKEVQTRINIGISPLRKETSGSRFQKQTTSPPPLWRSGGTYTARRCSCGSHPSSQPCRSRRRYRQRPLWPAWRRRTG